MTEYFSPKIISTHLVNSNTLSVEYSKNFDFYNQKFPTLISLETKERENIAFSKKAYHPLDFGMKNCYFSHNNELIFLLPTKYINVLSQSDEYFFACDISGWGNSINSKQWKLSRFFFDEIEILGIKFDKNLLQSSFEFKFVSATNHWCSPDIDSPNTKISSDNSVNFLFDPKKTGRNILQYELDRKISVNEYLISKFSDETTYVVDFRPWIFDIRHDSIQFGANIVGKSTNFRIFCPRATSARVVVFNKNLKCPRYHQMNHLVDGIWELKIPESLHLHWYYYQFLFDNQIDWTISPMVLDPYAKATVSSGGPGIILSEKFLENKTDNFLPSELQDLVILETHIRDVVKHSKTPSFPDAQLTFSTLREYIANPDSYFRKLGINCVELQPIQEFDYKNKKEYHWGYMPANWFSPASAYATTPENASQVKEFQNLVSEFHKHGISVILDVVYNHFGHSRHLDNIDKDYYFRHDRCGNPTNFSGCGNDFRTESPMAEKMIIDSLEHLIKCYNVDGFRFDLAELMGSKLLKNLQKRLKHIKPSLILISEPWSFRANIGIEMKPLSYSVWNDEYREFVKHYVLGRGNSDGLKYFLCGGLDFRSRFPCQSVNYIASHDDRGWVDSITENPHNNGSAPTDNDRRRTHLAAAILLLSVGIPMLSQGQDFLFSKLGICNTYNRGDLNALDYSLLEKNKTTHKYFRDLIKFRLSDFGKLLRLSKIPKKSYFRQFPSRENSAMGLMFNADKSHGAKQLIFAINPHLENSIIDFQDCLLPDFMVVADENEVFRSKKQIFDEIIENKLILRPLSCRIFSCEI